MLNYLLKLLRQAPKTPLNNWLSDMIDNRYYRRDIKYNPHNDRFEIPSSKMNEEVVKIYKQKCFVCYKTILEGTNIHMEIRQDSISFWIQ